MKTQQQQQQQHAGNQLNLIPFELSVEYRTCNFVAPAKQISAIFSNLGARTNNSSNPPP
jgi:hypothetical protein